MRALEVYLLLGLCAAQAQAAGEMGQIWLGAHAPAASATPRYHSTNVGETTNTQGDAQFKMPSAGKLLNLVVKCEGAPGSGKTFTWLARITPHVGGADQGTLTCYISNSDTDCHDYLSEYSHIDAIDADDLLTFQVTTSGGTATARDCVIGVQVAGAGDDVPAAAHSLILFGDATAVAPASTSYGAPSTTQATQRLNTTNPDIAGFIVPRSDITFSKLCVHLDSDLTGTKTETFYLRNSRTGLI